MRVRSDPQWNDSVIGSSSARYLSLKTLESICVHNFLVMGHRGQTTETSLCVTGSGHGSDPVLDQIDLAAAVRVLKVFVLWSFQQQVASGHR